MTCKSIYLNFRCRCINETEEFDFLRESSKEFIESLTQNNEKVAEAK